MRHRGDSTGIGPFAAWAAYGRAARTMVLAAGVIAALLPLSPAVAAGPPPRWLAAWAASTTAIDRGDTYVPRAFRRGQADDQSIRSVVVVTSPGDRLRLRLSNGYGRKAIEFGPVRVALQVAGPAVVPGTDHLVTFGGRRDVTIPAGAGAVSDPVDLAVQADTPVTVSMFVHGQSGPMTWHKIAHSLSYVAPAGSGDRTADDSGQAYTTVAQSWFWMVGVDAQSSDAGTVVALGDSITDGYPIVVNDQSTWPGILADRLAAAPTGQRRAVVNAGISGNSLTTVLCSECGPSAVDRLDRDALALPGVKDVIVFEGTNDLAAGARPSAVTAALTRIVVAAHRRGVRVLGATITPRTDTTIWKASVMEPERAAVNHWIRTSGVFDGVIDFDAALRDPTDPHRLAPAFDSGDHLHPSQAGYVALGNAVDLSLL